jgi:hypothetical protein
VSNVRHYDVPADKNNIQPRVGVAWEPWPTGKWLVRGGVGMYSQQHLLLYINRVQLEGPDGTATIALTPESPLFPKFPNVLPSFPSSALIPPRDVPRQRRIHNPYSVATAGIEPLFGRVTLSADYVFSQRERPDELVDLMRPVDRQPNTRRCRG